MAFDTGWDSDILRARQCGRGSVPFVLCSFTVWVRRGCASDGEERKERCKLPSTTSRPETVNVVAAGVEMKEEHRLNGASGNTCCPTNPLSHPISQPFILSSRQNPKPPNPSSTTVEPISSLNSHLCRPILDRQPPQSSTSSVLENKTTHSFAQSRYKIRQHCFQGASMLYVVFQRLDFYI